LDGLCSADIDVYHSEGGLDQLLQREDVISVIVALPSTVQPAVALKCLAAGKHVLMEKPVANDVKDAAALISAYEYKYQSQKLIFAVAEQFRFDRSYEKARRLLSEGAIGRLEAVHARVWTNIQPGNKWYETEWRKVPEHQGGFLRGSTLYRLAPICLFR
jgi:predicted dehydrogenase